MYPIVLPIKTSTGKCAPTPTLENEINNPTTRIKTVHNILNLNSLGINANSNKVITVKVVIECPDGKLEKPLWTLPIITKNSLSRISAGLGTSNISFSKNDVTVEISVVVNSAPQSLGT